MRYLRTAACWITAAIIVLSGSMWAEPFASAGADPAQEDWKTEFAAVCSNTQDAMAFSAAELKDLIARCDRLKPTIEKLEETQRKVYLKRLGLCRDLLVFVLESKKKR
jgi:hypothetical protein